jgi:hypothetical protein
VRRGCLEPNRSCDSAPDTRAPRLFPPTDRAARPRRLSPGLAPGRSSASTGPLTAVDRSASCGPDGEKPGVFHRAGRPVSSTQTRFFVLPTVGHGQPRPPSGCRERSPEGASPSRDPTVLPPVEWLKSLRRIGKCLCSGRVPRLAPASLTVRAGGSFALGADAPAGAPYGNGGMLEAKPTRRKDRANGWHEGSNGKRKLPRRPWAWQRGSGDVLGKAAARPLGATGCHRVPRKGSKGSHGVTKGSCRGDTLKSG